MLSGERPWSLAIFASRESATELGTAISCAIANGERLSHVDAIVNGNQTLERAAVEIARAQATPEDLILRVWGIDIGDKANAWNTYNFRIWPESRIAFFVDGYVRLLPGAIERLGTGMMKGRGILGGSGVPTSGRSASALREIALRDGGFHGNFCGIDFRALQEIRDRQIRLPIGMYRTDSLMSFLLVHGLAPHAQSRDASRLYLEQTSTWVTSNKHWWRYSDVKNHLKRVMRQAQGDLEKLAYKSLLVEHATPPEALPATVGQLMARWSAMETSNIREAVSFHPLRWLSARRLAVCTPAAQVASEPRLLYSSQRPQT